MLYLITPPKLKEPFVFLEHFKAALDTGGVDCVQLRLKDMDDDVIRRTADVLRPPTQERDIAFIMNDRPDLAKETGCDGVHVGQDDTSYMKAREVLGPDAIIGVTCKASRHLAIEAADSGADYVAFGAFFVSKTKKANVRASPDILEWWSDTTTVPCVAIGGITPQNCGILIKAGANFLAVISSVWNHPDGPSAAITNFRHAIESTKA